MLTQPVSASSILAVATTFHLGLAALRNHRRPTSSPVSSLAAISVAFAALPWAFPSAIGLVFGLAVHAGWFAACERLVPKPAVGAVAPRPVAPVRAGGVSPAAPAVTASRPKGFVQAPVLATFEETKTIKTIRVARPQGFEFLAGQFLAVRVRIDGKEHVRCYSISSAPDVRGYLEVSVRRQGLVSNALHSSLRPGAMLSIKSPAGAFRYPSGDDRPIVLLAGGVGITPLMSMLRHAIATEPSRAVTLVYSAHTEDDLAFRDELAAAARRHPQLRVFLAASSGSADAHVYPGRIDEGLLRAAAPEVAHSIVFVCGPEPMIDGMQTLLMSLGVPAGQIRREVFQAAMAVSQSVAATDSDGASAPASSGVPDRRAAGAKAGTRSVEHRMACARTGAVVAIRPGRTLLEAAEEGGVPIESLCKAGVCGTCRVQVTAGEVACESRTLDADDERQGFVLACVTTAGSDCTVDL